jgi:hypothetical protein
MSRTTEHRWRAPVMPDELPAARPKPTPDQLGVDPAALEWQRSGSGDGSLEVAFVHGPADTRAGADWVLLRVAGDASGRVLVYDRIEWACFLDGARKGEFDLARQGDGASDDWPASN